MNEREFRERFESILEDTLAVDRDEVVPTARFFHDLSGESIDLLDLSFQCQKEFGAKVEFQKMIDATMLEFDDDGRVKADSIHQLERQWPFVDTNRLGPSPTVDDLQGLLTVDALAAFVWLTIEQQTNQTGPVSGDDGTLPAPA